MPPTPRRPRPARKPSRPRKPAASSSAPKKQAKRNALLVRNLDPALLEELRARAAESGESIQHELHAAIRRGLNLDYAHARAVSEKWQAYFKGRTFPDTTEMLREDRER